MRMVCWEGYVRDETMATYAPIVVYWVYSAFLHLLPPLYNYRLHTPHEYRHRNLVSLSSVLKGVLLQQFIQLSVSQIVLSLTCSSTDADSKLTSIQPSVPVQLLQIIVAMLVFDTCQFQVHRYMHHNKFLYKHVHSLHHKLIVPYAFGALYNHPFEGLLDTIGGALSFFITGMTPRTAVFFFCLVTVKTVDDHSGLWLPANIFHLVFHNNAAYHDVHHQLQGSKYNFSQPFFPFWDRVFGTYMPYYIANRPGGGLEVRMKKKVQDL